MGIRLSLGKNCYYNTGLYGILSTPFSSNILDGYISLSAKPNRLYTNQNSYYKLS